MRLITCVAVVIMIFAMFAQAAEVPTSAGDKAMVFTFHGFDNLGATGYSDYGFGMRYYLSDGMAVRAGLTFGMMNVKEDPCETYDDPDDVESKLEGKLYGVEAVLEMHLEGPCASVSPYLGVGGGYTTGSVEYTDWTIEKKWGDDEYLDGVTDKTSAYKAFGVAGFEWAFTSCMTFGGEYRLGLEGLTEETEEEGVAGSWKTTTTATGFSTASVFLSVYW
ncbi:MAG: outer membrane beta-barrel protein [Candidatus Eisenbacteria bacterium]|nr:outer membrane beta-barrel protein [Candidatus Eisenbacteria bacterium]